MNHLSLFSGIGGIDLAAEWAGMKTVAFCEREPFPQKVLRKHWPDIPIYDDVKTLTKERLEADGIDTGAIGIISAGYPCQPESLAGERKGEGDDRWLWPEVRRLLQEIRPCWFIGENVFGHVSMGLDIVLSDLEDINYAAEAIIIPSAGVGAPHKRDRVIILGHPERIRCDRQPRRRAKQLTPNRYSELERGIWTAGTIESRLGGVLNGLSNWLDEYKWPAGLGAEQYEWEPPRVATGVKDRVGRLKALGNAVNPVQIYPIMAAIKAIDDTINP